MWGLCEIDEIGKKDGSIVGCRGCRRVSEVLSRLVLCGDCVKSTELGKKTAHLWVVEVFGGFRRFYRGLFWVGFVFHRLNW